MNYICPKPNVWSDIYLSLLSAFEAEPDLYAGPPPKLLILSGWNFSNDLEKKNRWEATVEWANVNGLDGLITEIPIEARYSVDNICEWPVGPYGGPMKLSWNYEAIPVPNDLIIEKAFIKLKNSWEEIANNNLFCLSHPIKFTGVKKRRLLVAVDFEARPTWGDWKKLNTGKSRRNFTKFRAAVNSTIDPHFVDHISFVSITNI